MRMERQNGNLLIVILIGVGIASLIYLIASPGSEPIPGIEEVETGNPTAVVDTAGPGSAGDFPKSDEIIRAEQFSISGVTYILELVATIDNRGSRKIYQRLVSQVGGVRSVVVPDVDREITDLGAYVLTKFVVNEPNKLVVFAAEVANPALPMGNLYRFDIVTGKFTKMFVSRFLPRHLDPDESASVFSPDKTKFLSISDRTQSITEAKNLYVVNLLNDQVKVIGSASSAESLTKNYNEDGEAVGSFRWLNDTNVEYSLFSLGATMPRSDLSVKNYFVNPAEK